MAIGMPASLPGRQLTFTQYRLTWKREGMRPKHKKYRSMKPIERMIKLLGPEPWTAHALDPDEIEEGTGLTVRESMLEERKDFPPIEYIKVTKRLVSQTAWEDS